MFGLQSSNTIQFWISLHILGSTWCLTAGQMPRNIFLGQNIEIGMVACVCNPSLQEAAMEGSQV